MCILFFFFKQKTAYEIKECDWSSDVCSSDLVIFRYDRGEVLLIEASPEGLNIQGRFKEPAGEGPAWPHPVIHNAKLYLRHGDVLLCYDVRQR